MDTDGNRRSVADVQAECHVNCLVQDASEGGQDVDKKVAAHGIGTRFWHGLQERRSRLGETNV